MKVLLYTVFKERIAVAMEVHSLKTEQCRQNAMLQASGHTIEVTVRPLGLAMILFARPSRRALTRASQDDTKENVCVRLSLYAGAIVRARSVGMYSLERR